MSKIGFGGWVRKIFRWIRLAVLYYLALSVFLVLLFRFVNPPFTPLMVKRCAQQLWQGDPLKLKRDWVSLDEISPWVVRAAIAAEDNKFKDHFGFDLEAIRKAYLHNQRGRTVKGASTITQQTCKNLFLWESRTYVRKAFEAYYTLLVELLWSKKRIMEVYLNIVETGKGIYGFEAAAQTYYSKSAAKLTRGEAAMIVAILPNPRARDPRKAGSFLWSRQQRILRIMNQIGPVSLERK